MKIALALTFYVAAIVFIYAGLQLAPEMTWPHTDVQWVAAHLLVIGMLSKLCGHATLMIRERR